MKTLWGKTIWITGASSGIGEAVARECYSQGARLIVSARDERKLESLRESLLDPRSVKLEEEHGAAATAASGADTALLREITIRPFDLTDPQAIEALAREAMEAGETLDILIHAAGISQRSLGAETDSTVTRRIMETNFFGPIALTQALLPKLVENRRGRIVVITSAFGKFGARERTAYAASKHALHGYFDSLRAELPPERIGITLIVPGAIATDISRNALTAHGSAYGRSDETITRGMAPERAARAIIGAILRGREEVLLGFGARLRIALLLKFLAPRMLTRILRRRRTP
jgi:short-subunit dehydrogenase